MAKEWYKNDTDVKQKLKKGYKKYAKIGKIACD